MSQLIRLIFALFFLAMTVRQVRLGDALFAALSASCATYWFTTWMWRMTYERD